MPHAGRRKAARAGDSALGRRVLAGHEKGLDLAAARGVRLRRGVGRFAAAAKHEEERPEPATMSSPGPAQSRAVTALKGGLYRTKSP